MKKNKLSEGDESKNVIDYGDFEGVDKAPGEEHGKKEKVTPADLKGKKVDGDPVKEEDQPLKRPDKL